MTYPGSRIPINQPVIPSPPLEDIAHKRLLWAQRLCLRLARHSQAQAPKHTVLATLQGALVVRLVEQAMRHRPRRMTLHHRFSEKKKGKKTAPSKDCIIFRLRCLNSSNPPVKSLVDHITPLFPRRKSVQAQHGVTSASQRVPWAARLEHSYSTRWGPGAWAAKVKTVSFHRVWGSLVHSGFWFVLPFWKEQYSICW